MTNQQDRPEATASKFWVNGEGFTREDAEELVFMQKHRDFRGWVNREPAILVDSPIGAKLVPLKELTDSELQEQLVRAVNRRNRKREREAQDAARMESFAAELAGILGAQVTVIVEDREPIAIGPKSDETHVNPFADFEVIHRVTRAQLIEDGELIDVTKMAREAGIKNTDVALTRGVFARCVEWSEEDNRRKRTVEDQTGRLWDVLSMAVWRMRAEARSGRRGELPLPDLFYTVACTPREGRARKAVNVELKLNVSAGDHGEPVLTILLPHED